MCVKFVIEAVPVVSKRYRFALDRLKMKAPSRLLLAASMVPLVAEDVTLAIVEVVEGGNRKCEVAIYYKDPDK